MAAKKFIKYSISDFKAQIKDKLSLTFLVTAALACILFIAMNSFSSAVPTHTHEYVIGNIDWCYNVLSDGTVEIAGVESYPPTDLLPKNINIPNTLPVDGQERVVTSIGPAAFYKGNLHNEDVIESITIPDTVTSIGNSAFKEINLISVTIPNSVKSIGNSAFRGCKDLVSVNMGNSIETIDSYAFQECSKLSSVNIPDSVAILGSYAFYKCGALEVVKLGNNVSAINDYTFCYCTNLESINIPKSVLSVRRASFYDCQKLTSITIPCDLDKSAFDGDPFFTVNGDEYTITCKSPATCTGEFTYTHVYGEPSYTWSHDETENKWICRAERTCAAKGDATETEDALGEGTVTREPTCVEMGETTYTAMFINLNFVTQTKAVEDIAIDPDAHDWESTWSSDEKNHWHKCELCGAITDKAAHEWVKIGIISEKIKYTCSVCGAEKTEDVPPSGGGGAPTDNEGTPQSAGLLDTLRSYIKNPQTGDYINLPAFLIIALASFSVAWILYKKRK